jgi:hypothetical protein
MGKLVNTPECKCTALIIIYTLHKYARLGKTGRHVVCIGKMRNADGTNCKEGLGLHRVVLLKWIFKNLMWVGFIWLRTGARVNTGSSGYMNDREYIHQLRSSWLFKNVLCDRALYEG